MHGVCRFAKSLRKATNIYVDAPSHILQILGFHLLVSKKVTVTVCVFFLLVHTRNALQCINHLNQTAAGDSLEPCPADGLVAKNSSIMDQEAADNRVGARSVSIT